MEFALSFKYYLFSLILSVFCVANFALTYPHCLEDQKNMLLELRRELRFDPNVLSPVVGLKYDPKVPRWNHTENCCSWAGVECDDEGHVISLQLDNERIVGEIKNSSILFNFKHLEKLNLAINIGCHISVIHNLTHLTHLNLSNTNFSGQVPLELSSLTRLVSLDLTSFFNLKIIIQNMTSLEELYLDYVDMSALGADWGFIMSSSLPNLRILSLRHCRLSGPLHSSLVQLHFLSVLHLDDNDLSTRVPNFFVNFSNLTVLTLPSCLLRGPFPKQIFQMPTLEELDLSDNENLSGTLPLFPVTRRFRIIRLAKTSFSGSLPNCISNLPLLSIVDLSFCRFTGTIPLALANLTNLTYLDLSYNSFSGSIPSIFLLQKLTYVDLGYNKLSGSLSSMDFESNPNLVVLNLNDNLLNGSIPSSLFGVSSLNKLYLSNNNFTGPVNEFSPLRSSNLEQLDLSDNKLEGPIPKSFFKYKRLDFLDLSRNSFNGTVHLGKFTSSLHTLRLSYNNLSVDASSVNKSSFPQLGELILASCNLEKFPDLRNLSYFLSLDLSKNQITGQIPSWIWEVVKWELDLSFNMLVDLQKPYRVSNSLIQVSLQSNLLREQLPYIPPNADYIDYSDNKLEGPLPLSIGRDIYFISLSNNRLSGTIPTSFCKAKSLQLLDLSNNTLSGSIPSCLLERLMYLRFLNLGDNNLSGHIPDALSRKCSLIALQFNNNNLKGKIPPSLANCKSLEVMDVGYNEIEDSFPCMIPSTIHVLVLRFNKFHGEVRCHKSCPNLQIIDIARNNFRGYLYSMNFSSWKGMLQENHVGTRFLPSVSVYEVKVKLNFKGQERVLVHILTTFTSIDVSYNHFQGEIPDEVSDLRSVKYLNLSHNALTGRIPNSFGNLKQLESLDLSTNQLTGEIPRQLAGLTFLSFLNLSNNNFVGAIPTGGQLLTFSSSSFCGNTGLCGFPLDNRCNDIDENGASRGREQSYEKEIEWDHVPVALGFGVGFGSIIWLLFGRESIRQRWSEKFDEIFEDRFINKHDRKRGHRSRTQRNQARRTQQR